MWEGGNGHSAGPRGAGSRARGPVRRFEDLEVWQTARELTRGIYRACKSQRLKSDRPLSEQMRRAAVSVGSNIAEGYELGTRKQQIERCYCAKGSAGELRSQVHTARDVELINDTAYKWLVDRCERVSRQLASYLAHLQRTSDRISGLKHAMAKKGAK